MRTAAVEEDHVAADTGLGLGHRLVGMQIDLLVLDRLPQPFHEHVVAASAAPVHADADPVLLQHLHEAGGGELRALVAVEDFRGPVAGDPVGTDGYPRPIWDHETGKIDRKVALYWRDNGYDLRYYLEQNWSKIGPDLVGKLRFSCGDMDNFYTNLAMYEMENFLKDTTNPAYGGEFIWGRPKVGHGFYGFEPWPMKLLETMAAHIAKNAPMGDDSGGWHYP